MEVKKLQKYFGKMVVIRIGPKNKPLAEKVFTGRLIRWLKYGPSGFVPVEKSQSGKYVEMKLWQKTGLKVFKVAIQISKIQSVAIMSKNI